MAARREYGIEIKSWEDLPAADVVVIAVAHDAYRKAGAARIAERLALGPAGRIVDVKAVFGRGAFGAVPVWTR